VKRNRHLTAYIALVGLITALIAVLAPISIPTQPVPITMQTMVVLLVSALFKFRVSIVAIGLYIMLIAFGLPVASNYTGGLHLLTISESGATGGFI
jgi:biotin transporter BioY